MLDFTLPNNKNILLPFLIKRSIYSEGVFFPDFGMDGSESVHEDRCITIYQGFKYLSRI